jgi:hypothetical protein
VKHYLASGELSPDDIAWDSDSPGWQPIKRILSLPIANQAPKSKPPPESPAKVEMLGSPKPTTIQEPSKPNPMLERSLRVSTSGTISPKPTEHVHTSQPAIVQEKSWIRRHGQTLLFIVIFFYAPISGVLAMISPSLGRAFFYIGGALFGLCVLVLLLSADALPSICMVLGFVLFLGGIAEHQLGFYFLGIVLAVGGYGWAKSSKQ